MYLRCFRIPKARKALYSLCFVCQNLIAILTHYLIYLYNITGAFGFAQTDVGSPFAPLGPPFGSFGTCLGAFGVPWSAFGLLGMPRAVFGPAFWAPMGHLGVPWGAMGRFLGPLGAPWGALGGFLDCFLGTHGAPGSALGCDGRFLGPLGVPWGAFGCLRLLFESSKQRKYGIYGVFECTKQGK